jgi:predicted metal-binding membrane protein
MTVQRVIARSTAGRNAAVVATITVATLCWVVTVPRMAGMDMGTLTELGPLTSFTGLWVLMMAAMMLPGASAAIASTASRRGIGAASMFAVTYLVVWTIAGLAAYAVYRPHEAIAGGALVLAAGCYELTPLKRHFRNRCREHAGSAAAFGLCCLGSSLGLMVLLLAVGVMSVVWMVLVAALLTGQKLVAPHRFIDQTVALAIVALGVVIVAVPSAIPGLTPSM